jgi:hypothetical protein
VNVQYAEKNKEMEKRLQYVEIKDIGYIRVVHSNG